MLLNTYGSDVFNEWICRDGLLPSTSLNQAISTDRDQENGEKEKVLEDKELEALLYEVSSQSQNEWEWSLKAAKDISNRIKVHVRMRK